MSLLTATLCKEEGDRPIKIEFFKSSKNGKHLYLGTINFTLDELKQNKTEFEIRNGKKNNRIGRALFKNLKI